MNYRPGSTLTAPS